MIFLEFILQFDSSSWIQMNQILELAADWKFSMPAEAKLRGTNTYNAYSALRYSVVERTAELLARALKQNIQLWSF